MVHNRVSAMEADAAQLLTAECPKGLLVEAGLTCFFSAPILDSFRR